MKGVPIDIPTRVIRVTSKKSQKRLEKAEINPQKQQSDQKTIISKSSLKESNDSLSSTTSDIANTLERDKPVSIFHENTVQSLMQYEEYRSKVTCPNCQETGSINKDSTTKSGGNSPSPKFKCNVCKKTVTVTQLQDPLIAAIGACSILNINPNNNNNNTTNNNNNNNNNINDSMELESVESISSSPPTSPLLSPQQPQQQHTQKNNTSYILQKLIALEQKVEAMQTVINENITLKTKIKNLTLTIAKMQADTIKSKITTPSTYAEKTIQNNTKATKKNTSIYNNTITPTAETDDVDTPMESAHQSSSTNSANYNQEFPSNSSTKIQQPSPSHENKKNSKKQIARYRSYQPTEKDLLLAERTFTERKENEVNNFVYTYVPIHRRLRSSEIRKKLTYLGIDNVQVLDTYSCDWNTAAILTHKKYQPELIERISKAKILISTYNHLDPIHIRDPKHQHLSLESKLELSKIILNNNMMRALKHMRYTAKYSVARSFFRDGLITLEQLQDTLKSRYSSDATGFVTPVTKP